MPKSKSQHTPVSWFTGSRLSVQSAGEGSEAALSEAEEINEVNSLKDKADVAFEEGDYEEALTLYNEALEIDRNNVEILANKTAVYIDTGDFIAAQKEASLLIGIQDDYPQGHYLLGIALEQLGQYKGALRSFLKSLSCDSQHGDILSDNIATMAIRVCKLPMKTLEKFEAMDPYTKLCEMGSLLYLAKKYELCIQVLEAAQKLETNQQGIQMKILFTMANAQSALKCTDVAISLYQDCLAVALSAHDPQYQTKALVNLASLSMDTEDVHQAIIYYERLLDLETELRGTGGSDSKDDLPDYWNPEFRIALHLNLSIAHKSINKLKPALHHAKVYVALVNEHGHDIGEEAESHYHVGMLYEMLQDYDKATKHFKTYLGINKKQGNRKGVGHAYGLLGKCCSEVHNWQLSITYHEQHLAIGRKLKDSKVIALATELLGDTYMNKGDYDNAVTSYEEMHKHVLKNLKERTRACCKLAKAFQMKKRHQYALFYYEEAQQIIADFDFEEFKTDIEYNSALVLQHSTQHSELEQARKYFERLIPSFEDKAQQMMDEEMDNLDEMRSQLSQCYDGMQNVLCKLGVKEECLQYSECHKKMKLLTVKNHNPLTSRCLSRMTNIHGANLDMWTMEKMTRVVNEQNATVLYYTVLPGTLLIWVLQPGKGMARFYSTRAPNKDVTFNQLIKGLCEELCCKGKYNKEQQYGCENRALPLKTTSLELRRQANEEKSNGQRSDGEELISRPEKNGAQTDRTEDVDDDVFPSRSKTHVKSPQRKLFDMLLSPVADILSELETGSPVIIVPDKELYQCPFPILEDWSSVQVSKSYNFTIVPSLAVLEKVTQHAIDGLRSQDELEFERAKSCLGGMSRLLTEEEISRSTRDLHLLLGNSNGYNSAVDLDSIDPRRTSNPRLLKSGALISPPATPSASLPAFSRESTFLSMISKSTALPTPPLTPNLKAIKTIGSPTPLDRMLHAGSLTTLTTRTATGTDIVSSTDWVSEFQQISDPDRCVMFGNPKLPDKLALNGKEWHPPFELSEAQKEVYNVASYCDVTTISGEQATKECFLKEIQTATVLHIATFGCLKEGFLVFSPNQARENTSGVPAESSYLVTTEDIMNSTMCAKLVVLSCGWSSHSRDYVDVGMVLPSTLLTAGAQCVLTLLWNVPNRVLEKFYYHFYSSLQSGSLLSTSVNTAVEEVRKEYSDPSFWAPFVLVGKDNHVSLHHVHKAMLHQKIDIVEREVLQNLKKDALNPKPVTPNVPEKEESMQTLQEKLSPILCHYAEQPKVVELLIDLLDDALKRIHTEEKDQKIAVLSEAVIESKGGLDLLHHLGFHFQPRGSLVKDPYVVFPHASLDEHIMSAFITLRAVSEIDGNASCLHTLYEFLPASQKNVSHMIDMLAITKHAPELQLKVSDLSVRPLWLNPKSKALLGSIGLHQVGMLLAFNVTSANRKLLDACLKFFLAVSTFKSPVLMHKLDVALLGMEGASKVSGATSSDVIRLPTLTPLILPRNTLHMSTPWACNVENTDEMKEKMRLARSKSELGTDFHKQLVRAKTWHQMTVKSQGDQSLEKLIRPKTKPAKVKVVQTQNKRVPVNYEPPLSVLEVDQRRDYAHFVLHQRVDNIAHKHRDAVKKLYLPYVQNM